MRTAILFLLVTLGAKALATKSQWTLRYENQANQAEAVHGCTANQAYEYQLPAASTVIGIRAELWATAQKMGLPSNVWGTVKKETGNALATIDLETGRVIEVDQDEDDTRATTLCQCQKTELHNCSTSAVRPLGVVFFIDSGAPAPHQVTWTDPLTEKIWLYRSPGMNWNAAGLSCESAGYRFPDLEELQVAQPRLAASEVGKALLRAGSLVWSATPGDDVVPQAFAMFTSHGSARWVMIQNPLPVACVKDPQIR